MMVGMGACLAGDETPFRRGKDAVWQGARRHSVRWQRAGTILAANAANNGNERESELQRPLPTRFLEATLIGHLR